MDVAKEKEKLDAAASALGDQAAEVMAHAGLEIQRLTKELERTRTELRHRVVNPWRQEVWLRAYLDFMQYKGATAGQAAKAANECLAEADRVFGAG